MDYFVNQVTIQNATNSSTLVIDGLLSNGPDSYKHIADNWRGNHINLIEIEPTLREANALAGFKGEYITLDLLHHENYNLNEFLIGMSLWKGKRLSIGYSGPDIWTNVELSNFTSLQCKEIEFNKCTFPQGFIRSIKENLTRSQQLLLD